MDPEVVREVHQLSASDCSRADTKEVQLRARLTHQQEIVAGKSTQRDC